MGYRASTTQCNVRLLPLRHLNRDQAALCEAMRRAAGRCWTDMLQAHLHSRGGKWLTSVDLGKRFKGEYALHSQSIQALAQKLEANVDAARQLKKENPAVRYPYHPKKYQTVVWKASAIHWEEDGRLLLSNGKRAPGLSLRIPADYRGMDWCKAELTWRADHYELCLTMDTGIENRLLKESGQVAGVDLGEVNIAAVATEAGDSVVVSGRALRAVKQLRNKRHAALTSRIARCKPGSRRQHKLVKSKARASARLRRQQRDILHKASRQVVEFCQANDVRAMAVGDVCAVQDGVDLGKHANQKISQWPHGQFVQYLSYKAKRYGIQVEQIPEDYSTRTCSGCGALIHRDVNVACNICSRACHGRYGGVQARTSMYLRPLGRSRAFETGRGRLSACGLETSPRTHAH